MAFAGHVGLPAFLILCWIGVIAASLLRLRSMAPKERKWNRILIGALAVSILVAFIRMADLFAHGR
jgi:hypothetical protein